MKKEQVMSKAEDLADFILRRGKHFLPHIARLCIVSTFIEDGLRMWYQWEAQYNFMSRMWGVSHYVAASYVLFNMVMQLCGSALVLTRKYLNVSLGVLALIIVIQTIAYDLVVHPYYLMRNLALFGGLILLAAESKTEGKSLFAGLPSMGDNTGKTYLQLGGRLFLIFMLLTLVKLNWSIESICVNLSGVIFALLIGLGYKTKLSSLLIILLLTGYNLTVNNWWSLAAGKHLRDYKKYNFFQILSITGGLLLVVTQGPGGYSIDEHKKLW